MSADAVIVAVLTAGLLVGMFAIVTLTSFSLRRPSLVLLSIAAGIAVVALVITAVAPQQIPLPATIPLALAATAAAILGGDPIARLALTLSMRSTVRDGDHGGIILKTDDDVPAVEVLRGGTTIGYLERTAAVLSLIAGFPEGLALVVALKGIGRFSELASAEARERFIIGTFASLTWACILGMTVRLALV